MFKTLISENLSTKHSNYNSRCFCYLICFCYKLKKFIEKLEHPIYRLSRLESLREKSDYFKVQENETTVKLQTNPHYWLQQDILQLTQFQYRYFFQNIILNEEPIPQIRVYAQFLFKFFGFNY